MATAFEIGETVVCSITVKTAAGVLTTPATSMTIAITSPQGTATLAATAMTLDSTGTYHYDWQTTGLIAGNYVIRYVATDGARITTQDDEATLKR